MRKFLLSACAGLIISTVSFAAAETQVGVANFDKLNREFSQILIKQNAEQAREQSTNADQTAAEDSNNAAASSDSKQTRLTAKEIRESVKKELKEIAKEIAEQKGLTGEVKSTAHAKSLGKDVQVVDISKEVRDSMNEKHDIKKADADKKDADKKAKPAKKHHGKKHKSHHKAGTKTSANDLSTDHHEQVAVQDQATQAQQNAPAQGSFSDTADTHGQSHDQAQTEQQASADQSDTNAQSASAADDHQQDQEQSY